MNRRQMRALLPPTRAVYETFMKQSKMEPVVEEIGEDARLLWIGQRQSKCVLLYFHGEFGEASSFFFSCILLIERLGKGGVFQFSATGSAPAFWNLIQRKLESKGIQTDAVMLNYSEYMISPRSRLPMHLRF